MATDKNAENGNVSLADLNTTLIGIENELALRALDRSRGELEHAYDFINSAAEAGVIDIECEGCEETEPSEGGDDDSGSDE